MIQNDFETTYHGHVVSLSQKDKSVFRSLNVIGKRKVLGGLITIYKIDVGGNDLEALIRRLQENMSTNLLFWRQEYYAHFYRDSDLCVVFRDKVIRVGVDPATWGPAIEHGRALGIALRQLDFSPRRVEEETY